MLPASAPTPLLVMAFAVGARVGGVAAAVHGVTLVGFAGGRGTQARTALLRPLRRGPRGGLVPAASGQEQSWNASQ